MNTLNLCVISGASVLLAACVGGGGPSAKNVRNIVDDPGTARALVGGSPLNASGRDIEAAYERKVRQASSLLYEIHNPDSFVGSIRSNCRGTVCITGSGARISTRDMLSETTEIGGIAVESDTEYSPVMTYRGIPIAQGRQEVTATGRPDITIDAVSVGGWLDHSGFGTSAAALFDRPREQGYLLALIDQWSIGDASGSRPDFGTTGTATWEGAMVATDTEFRHQLIGASTVEVDLARMDADVRMTNVVDIDAGTRLPEFGWTDVPVRADGTFGDARTLRASFYGPNQEEVGGIFTTTTLSGAFGADRK